VTPAEFALLAALRPIAERFPDAANTITKILTRSLELVIQTGKGGEIRVWERAVIAAASEYASERTAEEWLALKPFNRED